MLASLFAPLPALATNTTLDGSQNGGAPFTGDVYGNSGTSTPPVDDTAASNNALTLGNGTTGPVFTGSPANIYGGYAPSSGSASNNTLTVNGGTTISGNVITLYGGYSNGGNATGNTVTINGGTFTTNHAIRGGAMGGGAGDIFTGNTLELNSSTALGTVSNFETVKFGDIGSAGIDTLDTTVRGGTAGSLVKLDTQGHDVGFAGVIDGSGGIEKTGAGKLTLSGYNEYAGNTAISAGTLEVTGALDYGTYAGAIANDGTLIFNQNTNQTLSGVISGTGSLTLYSTGKLTLTGMNTYSGGTTISGSSSILSIASDDNIGSGTNTLSGGTLLLTGTSYTKNWTIGGGVNLIDDNGGTVTFAGALTGTRFLKVGSGTLTLTNPNNAPYAMSVIRGTLRAGAAGAFAGEEFSIDDNATLDLNGFDATTMKLTGFGSASKVALGGATLTVDSGYNFTYDGTITGDGNFVKSGTGQLSLPYTNTYTGSTTVNGGTLYGNIPSGTDLTVEIGATYTTQVAAQTVNTLNGAGNINLTSNYGLTVGSGAFSGVISGSGTAGLTKNGTGTLTLTGANTYSGGTTVTNGNLQIGNGGTTGSVTGDILNNALVTFNRSDALTYDGEITGTGGLAQSGAGTLTLTGANTYSGATTVSNGTLSIAADGNIGSGTNTLSGGTLLLTGTSYTKDWTL
ncbi:MAG: autotransporter-associated beta strand repeat-containing protein, partial [Candidatus Accumulibacter sp.]|nr:autotransporter-associated beta strand repeat-containing protein [Accumulibacter sp.]